MSTKKLVDVNINPLDDFYEYANGIWGNHTNIPDDHTRWGTFDIVHNENIEKIKNILENLSVDSTNPNSILGKLYKLILGIDDKMNQAILSHLSSILKIIDDVSSIEDVGLVIGFLSRFGIHPFFMISASEDAKQSGTVKLTLSVPNLTLPEREYYLDEDLQIHVGNLKLLAEKIFKYFNHANADIMANDVVTIESLIAKNKKSFQDRKNFDKLYCKTSIDGFIDIMVNVLCDNDYVSLDSDCASLDNHDIERMWKNYFDIGKLNKVNDIVVYDMSFFKKISVMIKLTPLTKITNYIKYVIIRDLSDTLIKDVDILFFEILYKNLYGQKSMKPYCKRVVEYMNKLFGELLGREYVSKHFDEESKEIVMDMVQNIKKQMEISIKKSQWMSGNTKMKALMKLSTFNTKIGYPDKWKDHSMLLRELSLIMSRKNSILDILFVIFDCNYKKDILDTIDKPRDPNKWSMNVHDVNAYYDPIRNEIVFPAGILQPPFFDKMQSICENYGGIGTIIGHEITHGYDDQGRKYDQFGNISNWWTENDLINFDKLMEQLVDQYNKYVVNGKNINGRLTLGENAADLGGVLLSYRAMHDIFIRKHNTMPIVNKKDFFISYANVWKSIIRPEQLMSQIYSNPHSPNKFRVYILKNIDEFYETFADRSSKNEGKMYLEPDKRIKIW